MLDGNLIVRPVADLIEGEVSGQYYFFNPRGRSGVVVLRGKALEVFKLCRLNKSIQEMERDLKWASGDFNTITKILMYLEEISLVEPITGSYKNGPNNKTRGMSVWLQMTDACNLRCGYCCINKKNTHMSINLAMALITKVVNDCSGVGLQTVMFKFAGGEPTLRWWDVVSLVEWGKDRFKGISPRVDFHIITNGTFLNADLLECITDKRLGISVSLDGVGRWHDKQRKYLSGKGSFSDVDTNIRTLLSRGVYPYILTTVTKDNVLGLTELAKYCVKLDLGFRFSFYRDTALTSEELRNDNAVLIRELTRCYEWMGRNLSRRSIYCHKLGDMNLRLPKVRGCGIGKNGITITSDGKLCLCQYEMSNPLGDVLQNNVIEVLRSQKRYPTAEISVDKFPVCRECKWKFVCGGGCPFLTERYYGDFTHYSPYCEVYQAILPEFVKLHALQIIHQSETLVGERR